ncbi:hypothetical protein O3P69_003748 [Scylla paramamosain]|uniref:Uncharacterized protein n=1 Tax=Scylla paramamosain TaxID=85552 RepID=A0AAW0UEN5_SCYPA
MSLYIPPRQIQRGKYNRKGCFKLGVSQTLSALDALPASTIPHSCLSVVCVHRDPGAAHAATPEHSRPAGLLDLPVVNYEYGVRCRTLQQQQHRSGISQPATAAYVCRVKATPDARQTDARPLEREREQPQGTGRVRTQLEGGGGGKI